MYKVNTYNRVFQLSYRGEFEILEDAMEEFEKAKNEYMESFNYEEELEVFMFFSRVDKD